MATKKEPKPVSKEEFDKLSNSVESLASMMTNLIDKMSQTPAKPTESQKAEAIRIEESKPEESPVPPGWRKIVDEILGPEFGINVVYPESGGGFQFKIIVPLNKSNASQAHLDFYKVDVRTKAISYSEGIEGVKRYCELVAKNLGIKKQNA